MVNNLQLFSKALKWLNKGKISHTIGAVLNPWSLNFADTLKDCEAQAATLQSEAESAMQAEIRDMHILLQATQSQLLKTESILAKSLAGMNFLVDRLDTSSLLLHHNSNSVWFYRTANIQ
jgi:hypothetical protein